MVEPESKESVSMLSLEDIPTDELYPRAGLTVEQPVMCKIGEKGRERSIETGNMAASERGSPGRIEANSTETAS